MIKKIAQKCIEIGIIKDLYEQGLLTDINDIIRM